MKKQQRIIKARVFISAHSFKTPGWIPAATEFGLNLRFISLVQILNNHSG